MAKIFLIACVGKKKPIRCEAQTIYISDWFKKAFYYAKTKKPDRILILSAKHKVLELTDVIEPYEETLNNSSEAYRECWAKDVIEQLKQKTDLQNDHFVFLAGVNYRNNLLKHIRHCSIPMEGLRIGEQLKWLKENSDDC